MNWLRQMNVRDRRLLFACLGLVVCMVVLLAVFAPATDQDDPVPSSYGTGNHGAKAAYLTLKKLGYSAQRWSDSLDTLSERADTHTTLILAVPFVSDPDQERTAIHGILDKGGRVLAIGPSSAMILPRGGVEFFKGRLTDDCKATPVGFDAESLADDIRMHAASYWAKLTPEVRTEYDCYGKPVVVSYAVGKGTVVWWADSLPLENRGISMGSNLELLLRSVGPVAGTQVYWDESLHGEAPSLWSYAQGTPYPLIFVQLFFVAALLLLSNSRRSGPLRPDPRVSRASPTEFVRSLGGLFHKAHASNAAVAIAYQHFRRQLQVHFGIPSTMSVEQAAAAIQQRMPAAEQLLRDLQAADSVRDDPMQEGQALSLVQALERHEEKLKQLRQRDA